VWCETAPVFIPDNAINPEPGPYSFSRTPYLKEIADAFILPSTREIWVYKPTQVGFTRFLMNLIGYLADQDPGALGLLMPDEDTVEEIFGEELKPTIDATPCLARRKSERKWDSTKDEIWLDSMPIFGLYAGSVQKLARRSLRYVFLDEIDKYRPFRREASPIQLLKKRLSNWLHRARLIAGSTPTTPEGNIAIGFESCPDKRRYWLPCPKCGKHQVPIWSQVKGFRDVPGADKWERANYIRQHPETAYYECDNCRDAWPGERGLKARIVEAGEWRSDKPETRGAGNIGFHTWGIVSPWLNLSDLAAEFVEAEGDADKTRDFRNARLALPYNEVAKSVRPSVVRDKKAISGPPLIVPRWATALFCTADTQHDWLKYLFRAWGPGYKSALIIEGVVAEANAPVDPDQRKAWAWDELYRIALGSRFDVEGGGTAGAAALLIDSGGDRTTEVYEFSRRDPRILPTKGMAKSSVKLFYPSNPKPGVTLWMIDTGHFKGSLWHLMHDADPTKWLPHREVGEQYCLEMGSESLVREKGRWIWKENGTARNEAWDCEVLQRAAAEMFNVGAAPAQPGEAAPQPQASADGANPLTSYRGRW
jgi:phage terminase large subunit GpA-like protein